MMYGGRFGEPKTSADMHLKVRYGGKLSEKGSSVDEPESASVSSWCISFTHVSLTWEAFWMAVVMDLRWIASPRLIQHHILLKGTKETDEENYLPWRIVNGVAEEQNFASGSVVIDSVWQ